MQGKRIILLVTVLWFHTPGVAQPCLSQYSSLVSAFCEGRLTEVVNSIDGNIGYDATMTSDFLHLKARANAALFLQYFANPKLAGTRLPLSRKLEVQQLAASCTTAYETAFSAAATAYEKACLGAEWWNLNVHLKFDADSEIMRPATIYNLGAMTAPLQDRIGKQEQVFKAKLTEILTIAEWTREWPQDQKDAFSTNVAREFGELAVIDIPDQVFDRILRDLPFFVCSFMPNIDAIGSAEGMQDTVRWYLWCAITQVPADNVERRAIEDQVKKWSEEIGARIDAILTHPGVKPIGSQYADKFLVCYEQSKDNSFVPYFKRVLFQYELKKGEQDLAEQLRQVGDSWRSTLADFDESIPENQPDEGLAQQQRDYASTIYSLMFRAFTLNRRPAIWGHLPGERIIASSESMNKNWFWVSRVDKVVRFKTASPENPQAIR